MYSIINNITLMSVIVIMFLSKIRKEKIAIAFFVLLSIVAPSVKLFGYAVSYDLVAFPFLIIGMIVRNYRIRFVKGLKFLFLYFFLLIISTTISIIFFDGTMLAFKMLGTLRYILEIYVICTYGDKYYLKHMLDIAVVANFFVMLLQYFDVNSWYWTAELFASDSAISIRTSGDNTLNRLYGTFNNIAPLGFFMVFMIVSSLSLIYRKIEMKRNFIVMILAFVCGFLAVSKTFMMLLAISCVSWLIMQRFYGMKDYALAKGKGFYAILVLLLFGLGGIRVIPKLRFAAIYNYYIESLISGRFLMSRFGSEGITTAALNVFKEHFLIGVGFTQIEGEFLGDSEMVTILHDGGIVGFLILEGLIIVNIYKSIRRKSFEGAMVRIALLATSVISGGVFSLVGVLAFSYGSLCDDERMNTFNQVNIWHEKGDAFINKNTC